MKNSRKQNINWRHAIDRPGVEREESFLTLEITDFPAYRGAPYDEPGCTPCAILPVKCFDPGLSHHDSREDE
jgi:hypothetical protein